MKIHNTLTRKLEELVPLDGDVVRMYTCGPTVYDYAHIGNYRAYIFEDILRRYIKFSGFKVTQVMNLTDVDDKTIKGSIADGVSLDDYTRKFKDAFFDDMVDLNIEKAEHYPAATGHVQEMIGLIGRILDAGLAYKSDDGSVYFNVNKFKDYGKLAHLDMLGLQAGARVAQDEYDKENVADFALWKAWSEGDGDVVWDSPWGRGRPGWHIECSAMSMKYLGDSFDIHAGGVDNIFPHHENEIAQSEAATGKQFVKYWLHCEHLQVDGKKMSKSLGNFYTLRDILDKGYSGREVRYVLLSGHYRQTLNFTFDAVDAAKSALSRVDEFAAKVGELALRGDEGGEEIPGWARNGMEQFKAAMDNDLNMPEALGALFDMIHAGNKAMVAGELDSSGARGMLKVLGEFDCVLGVLEKPGDCPGQEVLFLGELREKARKDKNWEESDRLRDEIADKGWIVSDTATGQKLKRKI